MVRINKEETGKLIKQKCDEQGLKAKQLCELLNVQTTTPYVWFNGKGMPLFNDFVKLCSILKCNLEDLLVLESDDAEDYIPKSDWRNSEELKTMLAEGASLTYNTESDEFMLGAYTDGSELDE